MLTQDLVLIRSKSISRSMISKRRLKIVIWVAKFWDKMQLFLRNTPVMKSVPQSALQSFTINSNRHIPYLSIKQMQTANYLKYYSILFKSYSVITKVFKCEIFWRIFFQRINAVFAMVKVYTMPIGYVS